MIGNSKVSLWLIIVSLSNLKWLLVLNLIAAIMVPYVSGNDSLLLDEPEELTSYAMVEDMAMIIRFLLMIKWDIVEHK